DRRLFFFFQAEDGIRDRNVTGVQTCALPICAGGFGGSRSSLFGVGASSNGSEVELERISSSFHDEDHLDDLQLGGSTSGSKRERSEERRVGKECGARRGADREDESEGAVGGG